MKHALSFDIEDWFHIMEIPELEDRSTWEHRPSIVEEKTDLILNILEENEVNATFYLLGWVAKRYPALSKKIVANGHEIGSHSFWHRRVYELTPEAFYEDLKLSIDILQDQTGVKIHGYRAPSFSIIPGTEWAFDVMEDLGLTYDASLFPAKRGHGGYEINQRPHFLDESVSKTRMPELPMSIYKIWGVKIPFSGGGYLRVLPESVLHFAFKKMEEKELPGVIYLHPRDFAPDCPKVPMPFIRNLKCYTGLDTTERKFRSLLNAFEFDTCENILKENLVEYPDIEL